MGEAFARPVKVRASEASVVRKSMLMEDLNGLETTLEICFDKKTMLMHLCLVRDEEPKWDFMFVGMNLLYTRAKDVRWSTMCQSVEARASRITEGAVSSRLQQAHLLTFCK